mmetsp:Transcript_37993/g.95522  ORF Transcript_37993/g.95522 Transcript_37993/m.95522 type:complete len:103 (-) Transcript_37993:134-442(-)
MPPSTYHMSTARLERPSRGWRRSSSAGATSWKPMLNAGGQPTPLYSCPVLQHTHYTNCFMQRWMQLSMLPVLQTVRPASAPERERKDFGQLRQRDRPPERES